MDILERLRIRDAAYHTKPFLSGHWGGIDGFNVPHDKLLELIRALETLAVDSQGIAVFVKGAVSFNETTHTYLPNLTDAYVSEDGTVSVDWNDSRLEATPDNGVWQEVRFYVS